MENLDYHFSGYATRNDLECGDGRIIRRDAFKDSDGQTVPLIWNHDHTSPDAVLGHALLENREDGVYAYCKFNETSQGQNCKQLVLHGDVRGLSIYANKLKQRGNEVIHGAIRELSLVMASANPGAYIDFVMAHSEDNDEDTEACYASYDENLLVIAHSDTKNNETKKEEPKVSEEKKTEGEKTVAEVFDTLTEEQKTVVYAIVGQALEEGAKSDDNDDNSEGGNEMKHNVFENDKTARQGAYLAHSDQEAILALAKSSGVGSFQAALEIYASQNSLAHSDIVAEASGFTQNTATTGNITDLLPEYHDVKPGAPELVTNDQGWISGVIAKVHKSPFSRIRTSHVDIRNLETLRAKGYKKGGKKGIVGNYALARRTTDPQTIYVKNALHKDDITDITDFDIVAYQYNIDKMMYNEELATAIMIGDGRAPGAEGKIDEDKIRPIWKDDELYTLHYDIDFEAAKTELQGTGTGVSFGANYIAAEAMINTVLYAREKFKGTGTPDMYITPHQLNVMLLARDMNGRRIYSSVAELATALNVGKIHTVEQFEGKTRTATVNGQLKTKKLVALIVNLADYSLGATKGGQLTHYTQFDIDFNQEKSLLEGRNSGALTKLWSALAIEEDVTATNPPSEEDDVESEA